MAKSNDSVNTDIALDVIKIWNSGLEILVSMIKLKSGIRMKLRGSKETRYPCRSYCRLSQTHLIPNAILGIGPLSLYPLTTYSRDCIWA